MLLSDHPFFVSEVGVIRKKLGVPKGDMETRRAIFTCLGSNFLIKQKKLNIQLRKPFKILFDNLAGIERELLQVRTAENAANKGQIVTSVPQNLLGRRRAGIPSLRS